MFFFVVVVVRCFVVPQGLVKKGCGSMMRVNQGACFWSKVYIYVFSRWIWRSIFPQTGYPSANW